MRLFIFALVSILLNFPLGASNDSCIIQPSDLGYIGEQVVEHLNDWCADAWCAGDFQHVFIDFSFNSDTNMWHLQFLTLPHEAHESTSSLVPINKNLNSREITTRLSECVFRKANILDLVTLVGASSPYKVYGITEEMSDTLMNCTAEVEKLYQTGR